MPLYYLKSSKGAGEWREQKNDNDRNSESSETFEFQFHE